ncbi:MAG: hypothetical protein U0K36_11285 [Bacteroidales bacterium]|nr:hypothetical protein [Bacteroidales bacterium]
MSYTPTEWKTGDIVSSQRLNKLEEGVKDAYEVMVINNNDNTLDKTWQEIFDAIGAGKLCVVRQIDATRRTSAIVTLVSNSDNEYVVNTSSDETFNASSSTGYPAANIG